MFSRIANLFFFAFVLLAAFAAATPWGDGEPTKTVTVTAPASTATEPASACTATNQKCCQSTADSDSAAASSILGLLGVVLEGVEVLVGLNCVSIVGNACSATAVCCEDNSYGNLISIGCVPITL
ncbi:hypothetical protein PLICRDRAFT_32095 [Plicaturopsis crispa FD-325 SS-3]|uniref:Hydrophobin n=1 Tax=Plicaturopsis crispa FD-325 SS-3 TaxID=944288 RepID=A0A0C9SY61_PLICR|nr:hypothetical protein PLICRDRAFT_32095 [Plicaturopsis crispa FD-325 SS-3]